MSSEYDETIARGVWVCTECGGSWDFYSGGQSHDRQVYRKEGQSETDGPEDGDPRYSIHSVFGRYVNGWAVTCGPVLHHRLIADEASA